MERKEKEVGEIVIKRCVGSLIMYERDNEGLRDKLDQPYREKWTNAKFILPSGKKKCERFPYEYTDEQILEGVRKKYNNFKELFFIHKNSNPLTP